MKNSKKIIIFFKYNYCKKLFFNDYISNKFLYKNINEKKTNKVKKVKNQYNNLYMNKSNLIINK